MLVGLLQYLFYSGKEVAPPAPVEEECCGEHATCEKDSLLAAASKDIVYFNDEELDRFRGNSADSYTLEEEEEWREVLMTLPTEEVPAWVRSIGLRELELPEGLRDELILIVGEQREQRMHA